MRNVEVIEWAVQVSPRFTLQELTYAKENAILRLMKDLSERFEPHEIYTIKFSDWNKYPRYNAWDSPTFYIRVELGMAETMNPRVWSNEPLTMNPLGPPQPIYSYGYKTPKISKPIKWYDKIWNYIYQS